MCFGLSESEAEWSESVMCLLVPLGTTAGIKASGYNARVTVISIPC